MGEPYAGQGYMSRAVRAALDYAFTRQRLHRIEAACLPTNEPSIRLLKRNGFEQEGFARAYLNINGQWRDHLLFARLDSDSLPPGRPGAG
jgi:ribosomal-protein-alanine N-acetyltransferase